jgi:hypothetical protein
MHTIHGDQCIVPQKSYSCKGRKGKIGRPHLIKKIGQLRRAFSLFIEITSDPYSGVSRLNGSGNDIYAQLVFLRHLPLLLSMYCQQY